MRKKQQKFEDFFENVEKSENGLPKWRLVLKGSRK